jgi:effector-binding domain-containing protein
MAEVQLKTVEPLTVMSMSFTGSYQQTGEKLDELLGWVLRAGHPWSGPPFGIYYDDPEKVPEDKLRAEVCVPMAEECEGDYEVQRKKLVGCEVACAVHQGPYDGLKGVYAEIFDWIGKNGYAYASELGCREVFRKIIGEVDTAEELVTEVQVPVKKAGA